MKSNQYSIKVFETTIDNDNKFISFMSKNYELFKNHLILIQGGISKNVLEYLNNKSLKYINNIDLPRVKKIETKYIQPKKPQEIKKEQFKIVTTPLRSGQIVEYNGDVLIFDRINSGSKIITSGNIIALNIVNGDIDSTGDFIIISDTKKSNIVFHGIKIDNGLLKNKLNKIEYIESDNIIITTISQKEFKWV